MLKLVSINPKANGSYSLLVDTKYTIGRKQGDIMFPDDSSISRNHAEILVEHPAGNWVEPLLTPTVTLIDVGSKFGTYATETNIQNRVACSARERLTLSVGDKIRFGLQWNEFQLQYTPLVVTTSSFKADQNFKNRIGKLGGHIVNDWEDCVTHVVMESVTLTVKAVCALLSAKPIVSPSYFVELLASFTSKKATPDPQDFLPPIGEREISNIGKNSFYPNPGRTALFAGKTFLFCSPRHMKKLISTVKAGGGIAKLVADAARENVARDEFIIMANPLDLVNAERSQKIKIILDMYRKAGKRFISDSEIGLAAVHNSIDKFCNPSINIKDSVLPNLKTTQSQSSSTSTAHLVPESQDVSTQKSSTSNETSRMQVDETDLKPNPVVVDVDDDVEIIDDGPTMSSSTFNSKRRNEDTSDLRTSKKRIATDALSEPGSKRLKEVAPSSSNSALVSRITRSSAKADSSKAKLTSLFNLSDSDDDEETATVTAAQKSVESNTTGASDNPDSQRPLIKVVDLKNLQTLSRTQEDSETTLPAVNAHNGGDNDSLTMRPSMTNDNGEVFNPGTDDVQTVRASVMDVATVVIRSEAPENTINESNVSNVREGTTSGKKRRREKDGEDIAENILAEKTRKMSVDEKKPTVAEIGGAIIPRVLTIRKPLLNPNLSRLETTLLGSGSSTNGKKNYKCFKKVLPKFLSRSTLAGAENDEPRNKNAQTAGGKNAPMNTSLESIRSNKSIRMVALDYVPVVPGSTVNLPPAAPEPVIQKPCEDVPSPSLPSFQLGLGPTLDNLFRKRPARNASRSNSQGGSSADSGNPHRVLNDSEAMPPPPTPVLPSIPRNDDDDNDEDDMWSFN